MGWPLEKSSFWWVPGGTGSDGGCLAIAHFDPFVDFQVRLDKIGENCDSLPRFTALVFTIVDTSRAFKMVCLNFRLDHFLLMFIVMVIFGAGPAGVAQTFDNLKEKPQATATGGSVKSAAVVADGMPMRRGTHGSIDGSAANLQADHPIARTFQKISEWGGPRCHVYGYVDQGFTWNPASPSNRTNGLVQTNYRSNDYQLNAIYLVTERTVDTSRHAIQVGGRLDTVYGTDARFMLTQGLDEKIVPNGDMTLAFQRAYLNLFLPFGRGASIKVGTFVTPIGNESGYAPSNFFYSHLLMDNIQPGTLTGFLVEYPLTDNLNISFGPNLGWGTLNNINHSVSYAGSATWTSTDRKTQLQFDFQSGKQRTAVTSEDALVFYYSLIFDRQLADRWHYVMEHDLMNSRSRMGNPQDDYEFYTLANYLIYQINHQWRSAVRVEWLQNDGGPLSGVISDPLAASGNYYNITMGLNWKPRNHLRFRPELRYDWQSRDPNSTLPLSFDDYTSAKQWLMACDMLWEF